jgi:dienelactone hydrolase
VSRFAAAVICAALILPTPSVAAPSAAQAFGQLPNLSLADMNPAGTLLAFSETVGNDPPRLVIFDLNTRKEIRKVNIGTEFRLRALTWADDETVLLSVTRVRYVTTDGKPKMYLYQRTLAADAAGGQIRPMLLAGAEDDSVLGASLVRRRTSKPKTILMASWEYMASVGKIRMDTRIKDDANDSKWIYNLFEVDTVTGKGRRIEGGSQFTIDWLATNDGKAAARAEWNPATNSYRVLSKQSAGWRELLKQTDGEQPWLAGLSSDEKSVLFIGMRGGPHDKLWSLPLDGSPLTAVAERPGASANGVLRDPLTDAIVAAEFGGMESEVAWLDAQAQSRSKALGKAFAGRYYRTLARSTDQKRVLVRVWGPQNPPVYYLVDYAGKTADIVGEEYPALADVALGEVRTINYKARDGYEVPAYLTTPPGSAGKNLPLVVLPHGGPVARDEHGEFDYWSQFLAHRGYAVLRPQFRGSSGFGKAHEEAGRRQWGRLMQDDVTDGVKAMVTQGVVDAKRVCIVGWSYGGYAALAGAAFTPELYACAASINGVSDLPALLGAEKKSGGEESASYEYWSDHIGAPSDRAVIERSPYRYAANVRAPILLVHGEQDTVVLEQQSAMMERALRAENKEVRYVKIPGDDHALARSANRVRMLLELETFLATHIGGSPAP